MVEARRTVADEVEGAARASYGRLLSIIVTRTRDIAAAEDALADAFAAALVQWPRDGTPANPIGWLVTAARRSIGHGHARRRTAENAVGAIALLTQERNDETPLRLGDDRLALMFACAHPAIDIEAQAPLMLQAVLGLDAARIASCFLVPSATMGQRLVRAKRKIRDSGIAFAIPEPSEIRSRIAGVLSAIYAAFGAAWDDVAGADDKLVGLASEAIFLARLLVDLLPGDPEAMGLLSLMLHCEARRLARRDARDAFVPLQRQDPALWNRAFIIEAEALLRSAAVKASPGRFQTEAAIQSLHAHQRMTGERFTEPLVRLYDALATFAPTTGVLVARAVAYAETGHTATALGHLDAVVAAEPYQPWWAARARILWLIGDEDGAGDAARIAAGLTRDPSVRLFLLGGGFRTPS